MLTSQDNRTAVVVDKHPLWRDAMRELLERDGVTVVASAGSLTEAGTVIDEARPDLVVWDGSAEDAAAARLIREAHPGIQQIVVSADEDPEAVERAFAAGAAVYCMKTAAPEDLAAALRQAFDRSIYVANGRGRVENTVGPRPVAPVNGPQLTKRERENLQLVAEGYSNSQLAQMLWVTEQTVKFHLSNIYRKLDVANRTEASRWAQLNGLLAAPPRRQVLVAAVS